MNKWLAYEFMVSFSKQFILIFAIQNDTIKCVCYTIAVITGFIVFLLKFCSTAKFTVLQRI